MKTVGPHNVWTRSQNGWFAGVCQGMGESFDLNPGMVRLIWLGSILFFGVGLLFYFLCAFILPIAGKESRDHSPKLLGVCSRLAERFEVQPAVIRVITAVLAVGSFGSIAFIYIILHFLLPERETF